MTGQCTAGWCAWAARCAADAESRGGRRGTCDAGTADTRRKTSAHRRGSTTRTDGGHRKRSGSGETRISCFTAAQCEHDFHVDGPYGQPETKAGGETRRTRTKNYRGDRGRVRCSPTCSPTHTERSTGSMATAAQPVHQSTTETQQSLLSLPHGSLEHPGNGAGDRTRALSAGAGTVVS